LNGFSWDLILTSEGFDADENLLKSSGGVPNYPEMRGYVPKVLAAYSVMRALCKTPPAFVTDGCVFQLSNGN
jgi:hypothetical protein